MRMLIIFIALAVIVLIAKRLWQPPGSKADKRKQIDGKMIKCAHCGTYIPESEALQNQDHWYCSREHMEADQRQD